MPLATIQVPVGENVNGYARLFPGEKVPGRVENHGRLHAATQHPDGKDMAWMEAAQLSAVYLT